MTKASFGLMFAALFGAMCASAATIEWTVSDNTGNDSDVRTEGRCLYAYTPCSTRTIVNGVEFGRYEQATSDFLGDASLDVEFARVSQGNTFLGDAAASWTGSDGYRQLLGSGWYKSVYSQHSNTLTLNGLTPGRRYLVQFWCCDMRSNMAATRTSVGTVEGKVGGSPVGTFGCNFTGTFTADGTTQDIVITYSNESKFNAFQVRAIDEAKISWTVHTTAGESDVRTDGYTLYAYKAKESHMANGVFFAGASGGATAWGDNISFSAAVGNGVNAFCWETNEVPAGAYSYSPAYRALVNAGFYKDYSAPFRRNVTLKGLVPGNRYLVQLWVFDNRTHLYASRTVLIDNSAFLAHSDGTDYGHGHYAVGTFTATGTEQTFSCIHRALTSLGAIQEELGPIQVRCLNAMAPGVSYWSKSNTSPSDASVKTDGTPVFAYAARETTVNGVHFRAFPSSSKPLEDHADWPSGDTLNRSAFFDSGNAELVAMVPESVQKLIGGCLYHASANAPNALTLKNLVKGRRYMLQIWICDSRSGREGWKMVIDGPGDMYYKTTTSPLGENATLAFVASNATHSVMLTNNAGEPHFNAVQLREMDGSSIGNGLVSFEKQVTDPVTGSVCTDGALVCAYAGQAATVNGVSFSAFGTGTSAFGTDVDWTAKSVTYNRSAFASKTGSAYDLTETPDSVIAMLGGSHYANASSVTNTLTLKNLVLGRRYLLQVWACDTRTGRVNWNNNFPEFGQLRYLADDAHVGENLTISFTATSDRYALDVVGMNGEPTFNAFQLRMLDEGVGYTWNGGAGGQWDCTGTNWISGGVEQDGVTLWDAVNGPTNYANIYAGTATLPVATNIHAASVVGTGSFAVGTPGTEWSLTVPGEVTAPSATVYAAWGTEVLRKTYPGTTTLAGACPALQQVVVSAGTAALAVQPASPVSAWVYSPGALAVGEGVTLRISSLVGDGTLKGPGRIAFPYGETTTMPTGFSYADGFAWCVTNGAVCAFASAADAAGCPIYVPDPRLYLNSPVATVPGAPVGKPAFVFGDVGWTSEWNEALSGWTLRMSGLTIIFR